MHEPICFALLSNKGCSLIFRHLGLAQVISPSLAVASYFSTVPCTRSSHLCHWTAAAFLRPVPFQWLLLSYSPRPRDLLSQREPMSTSPSSRSDSSSRLAWTLSYRHENARRDKAEGRRPPKTERIDISEHYVRSVGLRTQICSVERLY
jgi:hypothetical protein